VVAEPTYPLVPRSNRQLRPGQYWAIPLSDGRFAAGRVMAVPAFGPRDRTGVVVGLMDWVGDRPPTSEDLAGRPVLVQAKARFEAITMTGGSVLGLRPLEADGLVAMDAHGLHVVGPVHKVWGGRTIAQYAERAFVQH
jgi:hypothetical protein